MWQKLAEPGQAVFYVDFSSQSGHMGEGHVIQSDRSTHEWETGFTAESPADVIRRAVCEHPVPVTKP
jgi:hypothetical protein